MTWTLDAVFVASRRRASGRLAVALALAGAATFSSMSAARAEAAGSETSTGPCDALADYLRAALAGPTPVVPGPSFIDPGYDARETRLEESLRSTSPTAPMAYANRVTPACHAETRRDALAATAAIEAARSWTQRTERGWIDRGRIIRCAMQDVLAYNLLATWGDDYYTPEARAVCASAVATWPDAERVRDKFFARGVRRNSESLADWEIDEAIVAAANVLGTVELREQLVPVLVTAHARRALGYDRLRDAVCTDDGRMSSERAQACSALPAGAEHERRRSERPQRWLIAGGTTALYGGLVAGTFLSRNDPEGRWIQTTAGVVAGVAAATTILWVATADRRTQADQFALEVEMLGSVVAGAVIGGVTFHALSASPAARAPLTAVGFAPLYLNFLNFTFD